MCCLCNRLGKCKKCLCVKEGRSCVDCLPSHGGGCCNPAASSSVASAPSASVPIPLRGPARSSSVSTRPSTSASTTAPVPRVPLPVPLSNSIRPAPTQVSALTRSTVYLCFRPCRKPGLSLFAAAPTFSRISPARPYLYSAPCSQSL